MPRRKLVVAWKVASRRVTPNFVLLEIGAFRDGDDDGLQCAGGFYLRRSIGAYCLRPKRVQGFDGEFVLCAGCAVWNLQAGEIEKTFNRGIVSAELREVNTRGII